ncbi:condensation domain-containing protein [Micromonospora sp. NPDC048868]|uniref:condensation domain-containing protein n=1 Tax=Micromonospora sp. NPDC048868 TaxID=3364258 RepID=UPI003722EA98
MTATIGSAPSAVATGRRVPLSYAQEAMWLSEELVPGLSAYTVTRGWDIDGALDHDRLERAFTRVVRRHAALRSALTFVDGSPALVVNDDVRFALTVTDLRHQSADGQLAAVQEYGRKVATEPFDLTVAPVLHARLFVRDVERHTLVVSTHHMMCDASSVSVLADDLGRFYADGSDAGEDDVLPVQYDDYVSWQRSELERDLGTELDYWQGALANLPTVELPGDRLRPAVRRFRSGLRQVPVDDGLMSRVRQLARDMSTTPYLVLLSGFEILLARLSGQREVVLGAPVAGRDDPDLQDLVGFFINTVVLRGEVDPEVSSRQLLQSVAGHVTSAFAHQEAPFHRIVERLNPSRDMSRHPLYQVTFQVLQQRRPLVLVGLTVADVPELTLRGGAALTSEFDLVFDVLLSCASTLVECRYAEELFDAETVDRFVDYYLQIIAQMMSDPDRPVGQLRLRGPVPSSGELAPAGVLDALPAGLRSRVGERDTPSVDVVDADGRPVPRHVTGTLRMGPNDADGTPTCQDTPVVAWWTNDGISLLRPASSTLPEPAGDGAPTTGDGAPEFDADRLRAQMVTIWAEELGVAVVRPDDDFFDLGGGSLVAARVVRRVRSELSVSVSLLDLFDASTINGLLAIRPDTRT